MWERAWREDNKKKRWGAALPWRSAGRRCWRHAPPVALRQPRWWASASEASSWCLTCSFLAKSIELQPCQRRKVKHVDLMLFHTSDIKGSSSQTQFCQVLVFLFSREWGSYLLFLSVLFFSKNGRLMQYVKEAQTNLVSQNESKKKQEQNWEWKK